jgi:hypothetical protein
MYKIKTTISAIPIIGCSLKMKWMKRTEWIPWIIPGKV